MIIARIIFLAICIALISVIAAVIFVPDTLPAVQRFGRVYKKAAPPLAEPLCCIVTLYDARARTIGV